MSAVRESAKSPRHPRPARHTAAGPAVAEAHLPADAELHDLAERVLGFSDADETEVHIDFVADALTRFANNTIHQNVAEQTLSVSVRTVFDGRTARATTNKTDDDSLRRAVADSADRRRDLCHWASATAMANSKGLFASYRQSRAEFSITILERDSSGGLKASAPDSDQIDPEALAERASEKAAASRHPKEVEPGRWTVILEPAAVLDLVGFLFYDFAGT